MSEKKAKLKRKMERDARLLLGEEVNEFKLKLSKLCFHIQDNPNDERAQYYLQRMKLTDRCLL